MAVSVQDEVGRRRSLFKDFSISAVNAGFVTVLVGITSSAVVILQAAQALGATPGQIASWMWALGLGMGLSCIGLSLRYRMPLATAWSTPGAALLITGTAGVTMPEAIGAFLVSGALITLCGFSGWFERIANRIPLSLAAAMLSGVLLRFGMDAFVAMKSQLAMVLAMFAVYLVARRWFPRYAVSVALLVGVTIAGAEGLLQVDGIHLELTRPEFVAPRFSGSVIIGVALPLFIVTMVSQNLPGTAAVRSAGYDPPISPVIGWTGIATMLLAPFGGFALNLAAITAAICVSREAHEDPNKRYLAAVFAGVFYLLIGLFGGATIGALFAAFPRELVLAIAGLALLGTIGNGLAGAMAQESEREPALITFLITASGVTLFGIGSAFWGLVGGAFALVVLRKTQQAR
jgi:benzoate membrane transport protein